MKAVRSKTKPRVPGTRRAPSRPPICPDCFLTFLTAFEKVNAKTKPEQRLSQAELEAKAQRRSRAVKFGDEWACPRHTKLEDETGQELMLSTAYPNRAARRSGSGKDGRKANGGRDHTFKRQMTGAAASRGDQ